MSQEILRSVETSHRKEDIPQVRVGDTIDVHVRIIEGAKERIQVFNGVVIRMQGSGLNRSFTVRRIVANEGVERTFLLHSPRIASVEVKRGGHVRRAKLYFLRDRVGKKRRLPDRRRGVAPVQSRAEKAAAKAAKANERNQQTSSGEDSPVAEPAAAE